MNNERKKIEEKTKEFFDDGNHFCAPWTTYQAEYKEGWDQAINCDTIKKLVEALDIADKLFRYTIENTILTKEQDHVFANLTAGYQATSKALEVFKKLKE